MLKYFERVTVLEAKKGPRWKGYVIDSLLSVGGSTLVTAVIYFARLYPGIPTVSLLYLLVVLALASLRGLYAASLASLLSLLAFDYFFFPPHYTLAVVQLEDLFTLVVFLVVAVMTSQLAAALRSRAEQARNRENELRRLYEQAQELASLQERQRLAQELHDSVSQALYGISLGAHTAQEALESDQEQARESLAYVIDLTEAGLAEMRALIFELRPESLETEGLVIALSKQVAVLQTRYRLTVDATLDAEPNLPLELKHTLYRIAQEALHNVVKHARASAVVLQLTQHDNEVCFLVRDNGRGFDPSFPFPGHFGVRSMQERAIKVGGSVTIESAPEQGTSINVRIPVTC
ncbi:MAG TPA: sensor histidine kinase [Ktedonobacteraceae bacterium]|nr:sensor histidine kinase [Ktedonobacteraceae bacterium]